MVVGHELQNGQPLLITSGVRGQSRLVFALEAYFDHALDETNTDAARLAAPDTLDSCFGGVVMIVNQLREEVQASDCPRPLDRSRHPNPGVSLGSECGAEITQR